MKRFARFTPIASLISLLIVGCSGTATTQSADSSPVATPTIAASPVPAKSTAPSNVISSGNFMSGEHPTQGLAQIVSQNDKRILKLNDQFSTSTSGPDLVVALHRSANVIGETTPPAYPLKEGDYIVLASLKQFNGAQSYEIPDNVNLGNFQSAVIWCRQFNATFGSAALKPNNR